MHPSLIVADDCAPVSAGTSDSDGTLVPLCDYQREIAITRAGLLMEYFHAEQRAYAALWHRHGGFEHAGKADRALGNAQRALRLMEALIKDRSAEMVARMEAERGIDVPACANEARA